MSEPKPLSIPIDDVTDEQLVESQRSGTCPACGRRKGGGITFCESDLLMLDNTRQTALCLAFGEGYREAFLIAMAILGRSEFILAPPTANGKPR